MEEETAQNEVRIEMIRVGPALRQFIVNGSDIRPITEGEHQAIIAMQIQQRQQIDAIIDQHKAQMQQLLRSFVTPSEGF